MPCHAKKILIDTSNSEWSTTMCNAAALNLLPSTMFCSDFAESTPTSVKTSSDWVFTLHGRTIALPRQKRDPLNASILLSHLGHLSHLQPCIASTLVCAFIRTCVVKKTQKNYFKKSVSTRSIVALANHTTDRKLRDQKGSEAHSNIFQSSLTPMASSSRKMASLTIMLTKRVNTCTGPDASIHSTDCT